MADWVSLAASALGAGVGAWQNNKNVNKQIQYQKQENEKIRAYNLQLAKMQNKWNLQLMHSQNAYNSPSAQIMRMKEAGLNPDMMYGSGVSGNLSASSAPMTSGSPAAPMDWSSLANRATFGNVVDSYLDAQLKQAQIDNINSDTKKKGAETSILSDDAAFRKAFNQGQLDTMYAQISLQGSQVELNDAQIKKMQHEIQQIDALTSQIHTGIVKMRNDIAVDNARLNLDKLLNDAQVKQAYESANLSRKQAERLVNEWEYVVRSHDDSHEISLSQNAKITQEKDNLKFHADMTYGDRDRDASMYIQSLKFLNQLTTFALPFLKK